MSKIDVHHHFHPEAYTKALGEAGGDPSGWTIPPWTVEADQQIAKDIGVKTSILSITAPGACIIPDPTASAALARSLNETAASIRDAQPTSYGFFASLPSLLNTAEALTELAYAFDELNADGVILFTRYGDGNYYLGHEKLRDVWKELDRREAVVFVHPTYAVDTKLVNGHMPQPMFDYPHETGRAGMDMILSDLMPQVRNCKIILSHAGGTLPFLTHRVAEIIPHTPFSVQKSTKQIYEEVREFYFDTALSGNELILDFLINFAKPGHVLFGSDFPNAPTEGIVNFTKVTEKCLGVEGGREGALGLFPRLGG